jgi:hypothetical protein
MLLGSPSGIGQKNMKKNEVSTQSHGETRRTPKLMENSQHGHQNQKKDLPR